MKDALGHGSNKRGWSAERRAASDAKTAARAAFEEKQHRAKYGDMSDRQLHQVVLDETANRKGVIGHPEHEAKYQGRVNAALAEQHARNQNKTAHITTNTIEPPEDWADNMTLSPKARALAKGR